MPDDISEIVGDPEKMRVQIYYESDKGRIFISLTDQATGQEMVAAIPPKLAKQVGDRMFQLGCDMEAKLRAEGA